MPILELTATEDSEFQNDSPNFNNGLNAGFKVGEEDSTNTTYRAALKFSLAKIPFGSIIKSVNLKLTVYGDASNKTTTLNIYRITSSWSETTITWNTQPSKSSLDGNVSIANGFTGQKTIPITIALVQGWLDRTITNHGLFLQNSPENDDNFHFRSREYGTAADRPILEVEFLPVGGAALFALA